MPVDLPFVLYGLGLTGTMVFASLTVTAHPNWRLAWAALAVVGNWIAGTVFALTTGVTDGWWFSVAIDAMAAAAVLYRIAIRWQVALAATYCLQIAMHAYYASMTAKGIGLPWPYYSALTAIAWLQLLLVIGWSADIWFRHALQGRGNGRHSGPQGAWPRP